MALELAAFNADEGRDLQMGIGIATGAVIAGNIGSEQRTKYGVVGSTINMAARFEAFTLGNQILIGETTLARAREQSDAEITTGKPLLMRAKGRRAPVPCHPVKAVGAPWDLRVPRRSAAVTLPVSFDVICAKVEGKEVSEATLPAHAIELGAKVIVLEASWRPEPRTTYRLSLLLRPDLVAENIYAMVADAGPIEDAVGAEPDAGPTPPTPPAPDADPRFRIELRFTSVPTRERELLANVLVPV